MSKQGDKDWIDDIELENVQVLWGWSDFAGRGDQFNEPGRPNFTIILPEDTARELSEIGWNVKEREGFEEGDPPRYTLEARISYKFEAPRVFLIKGKRKIRADERDLSDIRRDTCEQIDVILTPSRWVQGGRTGVTAYVKEMYAKVRESRFSERYADYEEI